MTKRRLKYVADVETTVDREDCRVWGFGIMNVFNTKSYAIGNDINEMMRMFERVKADVYFHNLRFDGSFIVNWLYRNGFQYSETPAANTFNTTISKFNQWYKIQVVYDTDNNGRPVHTTFYDSLKKLPFRVSQIADMYGLEHKKGEIDYEQYRAPGHEITREERSYIYNHIKIMADALRLQFKEGLVSMTAGADALKNFKQIITSKAFETYYPKLSMVIDNDIRKAYKGGFTWLNPKFKDKDIGAGLTFDVNSLYPYIMYDRDLPYGVPVYFEGRYEYDDRHPLYIQHIKINFDIKEGCVPTIQIKKSLMFSDTEYLKSSDGYDVDLYVTNVDLELIKSHYTIHHIEYLSGWKFKKVNGVFHDYIDKWMEIKSTHDGGMRVLAKLMLNSLYGKFATNPLMESKIPILNLEDRLQMIDGESSEKDPVYTAMGVFITSYARDYMIRTAQKVYPRLIYCDTDSLHLIGTEMPDAIKDIVDDKKLGYWDFEMEFKRAKYLRAKSYIQSVKDDDKEKLRRKGILNKHDLKVTVAGLTEDIRDDVTFDNFKAGLKLDGKLMPVQVPGGIVLEPTTFTIN